MDAVFHEWPYVGLLLALGIVVFLAVERRASATPRWRDPTTVLGLLWPMYMVHQFEEHGIDALGRRYSFLGELCQTLGYGAADPACPGNPPFIFAVNVLAVWIAGAIALTLRRRRPLVAAAAWGMATVNAVTHLVGSARSGAYNPGVLTSLVLFLPLSFYMLHTIHRANLLPLGPVVWRLVVLGVVLHVVLLGSLMLRAKGILPYPLFLAVNALNGFLPLLVGTLGARPRVAA